MPKRSSVSALLPPPFAEANGLAVVAGGRAAAGFAAGRGGGEERGAERARAAASSGDDSTVLPAPAGGSAGTTPDLRTWKTFLHEVQRTRTPRSVTLSSAIRNLDEQVGH
jgi:hypothetical protein